jgi:hypothetical protein
MTAPDGHEASGAKGFAVHDQRFHRLGHAPAALAAEDGLLFRFQSHVTDPP